ncbi:MAG: hypothetical protein FWE80_06220, partial [Oscillospiraceae bacterium]|nr:hypothetical protein [Oscillospiraceae bacterium]
MNKILKRLLGFFGGLLLLWYVGYQVISMTVAQITVEMAVTESLFDMIETEAVVIRGEVPVPGQSGGGFFYYTLDNGGRVAKNGQIARIYDNENAASIRTRLNRVEEEIAALKAIELHGSASLSSMEVTRRQTADKLAEIGAAANAGTFGDMRDLSSQLLLLFNRQQMTVGKVSGFGERLADLEAQRDQLADIVSTAGSPVLSPEAGYFVSRVDGFEDRLKPEDALKLKVSEINGFTAEPAPALPAGYVGKITLEYNWYIACVAPTARVEGLYAGKKMRIRLPFVTSEPVEVTVAALNAEKDDTAVIFSCGRMSEALSDIRRESMQILLNEYKGLRVPDAAVRFRDDGCRGV